MDGKGFEYDPDSKPAKGKKGFDDDIQPIVIGANNQDGMDFSNIEEEKQNQGDNSKEILKEYRNSMKAAKGKGFDDDNNAPIVLGAGRMNQNFEEQKFVPSQKIQVQKSFLEQDELIANMGEIQAYQNIINCSICTEILVLSKEPQYCQKCQSTVFCKSCISKWVQSKGRCPLCQTENPHMADVKDNPNLLGLMNNVKLYCKWRPKGCEEIIKLADFEKHNDECGECKLCKKNVIKKDMHKHFATDCEFYPLQCAHCNTKQLRHEMKNHKCYQSFATGKNGSDYYLTKSRITNMKAVEGYFKQLQCAVCSNLLRNPKQCDQQHCQRNMCEKCIYDKTLGNNQCPCCKKQNANFVDILRPIKNLLQSVKIKCNHCKLVLDYEHVDNHEFECGYCQLCKETYTSIKKFPDHHLESCSKFMISCIICNQTLKRSKFINHQKCDKALAAVNLKQNNQKNKSQLNDEKLNAKDQSVDLVSIDKHWKLKTKKCYILGLGRWCKVVKRNVSNDIEGKTKLIQILFMMIIAMTDWGLGSVTLGNAHSYAVEGFQFAGLSVDIALSFLLRVIFYSLLASKWEGYESRAGLKVFHTFVIIFITSFFPYADFLFHLGYRQTGYKKKDYLEPYPEDFTLPKHVVNYQGYKGPTKGGHFYFLALGYARCLTSAIRLSVWLAGMAAVPDIIYLQKQAGVTFIILGGHLFFCICMGIKLVVENVNFSKKQKYRSHSLISENDHLLI
eukprot:403357219